MPPLDPNGIKATGATMSGMGKRIRAVASNWWDAFAHDEGTPVVLLVMGALIAVILVAS